MSKNQQDIHFSSLTNDQEKKIEGNLIWIFSVNWDEMEWLTSMISSEIAKLIDFPFSDLLSSTKPKI